MGIGEIFRVRKLGVFDVQRFQPLRRGFSDCDEMNVLWHKISGTISQTDFINVQIHPVDPIKKSLVALRPDQRDVKLRILSWVGPFGHEHETQ